LSSKDYSRASSDLRFSAGKPLKVITSVDHKGVTCYGLRARGVESRSLMKSVETRDLPGKADRSRVNSNTKRVEKSRHVDVMSMF